MCFEGEQNREGHGPQTGQYLHSWGRVVTVVVVAVAETTCEVID